MESSGITYVLCPYATYCCPYSSKIYATGFATFIVFSAFSWIYFCMSFSALPHIFRQIFWSDSFWDLWQNCRRYVQTSIAFTIEMNLTVTVTNILYAVDSWIRQEHLFSHQLLRTGFDNVKNITRKTVVNLNPKISFSFSIFFKKNLSNKTKCFQLKLRKLKCLWWC